MSKLRVLYLTWGYPTPMEPVSAPFCRNQVEGIVEAGVSVDVCVPVPYLPPIVPVLKKSWQKSRTLPAAAVVNNVSVRFPRYPHFPGSMQLGLMHRLIAQAVRRSTPIPPDVIHANFAYPFGLTALLLRQWWKTPVVTLLHGGDVNIYPTKGILERKRFVEIARGSDRLLAVSGALAKKTSEISGRTPKVALIGIRLDRFRSRDDKLELRRKLGLPLEHRLILYVGYLNASKGTHELLESLTSLRDQGVVGVIAGHGPLEANVKACTACIFLGSVNNDTVAELMSACDVFVLPSYSEGMPTVLVEAGASGIPIIATSVGGIPELLADDCGIMVEPGNPNALRCALERVLANPEAARERTQRLGQRVAQDYDCIKNGWKLRELYEEMLRFNRSG